MTVDSVNKKGFGIPNSVFSIRNAMLILDGLPEEYLPGVVFALAYRAGKAPIKDKKESYLEELRVRFPDMQVLILDAFRRGIEDSRSAKTIGIEEARARRIEEGRGPKEWTPESRRKMPEDIKREKVKIRLDKVIEKARESKSNGMHFGDFCNANNVSRLEKNHPGFRDRVKKIWQDNY